MAKRKAQPKRPGKGWIRRKQMAELLELSEQHIQRLGRKFPEHQTKIDRGPDRGVWIHAPGFLRAWASQLANGTSSNGAASASTANAASKGELVQIKKQQQEIALQKLRGDLIARSDVRVGFGHVAVVLRDGIETLQRVHGEDAAQVIIRALDRAEHLITSTLSDGRGSR